MTDLGRLETALTFMEQEVAYLSDMHHRKSGHQEVALKRACQALFWFFAALDLLNKKTRNTYEHLLTSEPELSGLVYARHHATHRELGLLQFALPQEGPAHEIIWAALPPLSGTHEKQHTAQSAAYKQHLEGKPVVQALSRVPKILRNFASVNEGSLA